MFEVVVFLLGMVIAGVGAVIGSPYGEWTWPFAAKVMYGAGVGMSSIAVYLWLGRPRKGR